MSEESEIALGRRTHKEILQRYNIYNNPQLQAYVSSVGEKLAENSHRSHLIYRFTVLDSKDINAFALPGGYIYVTRGLLAYLNSESTTCCGTRTRNRSRHRQAFRQTNTVRRSWRVLAQRWPRFLFRT